MKVDRKIASSETTSVRKVNGNGSICLIPGMTLRTTQPPNHPTWTQTKVILPQKRAIASATRSDLDRSCLAASSNCLIISTLRFVRSSDDPLDAELLERFPGRRAESFFDFMTNPLVFMCRC